MKTFQKHISRLEMIMAGSMYLLLIGALVTQFFLGGGVALLIMVLSIFSTVYTYLVFIPETYEFREKSFAVVNGKTGKMTEICYSDIVMYDTVGSFYAAKRDFDTVEVILSYKPGGKGRTKSIPCHPKNVHGFVNALLGKCPHLQEDAKWSIGDPI